MALTDSTTRFKADISQLKSAMQQAQKQVSLANSEFKKATAGMENWSQSATGLQAKLKQLDSTLTAQKTKLNLLKEEYEKTTKAYGENSAAALRVKTAMNNQEAAIAKTEKEIAEYSEELQKAEKYGDNFSDTMEEMDNATEKASDGFTVMKGALANLVADGIRLAADALKDFVKDVVETGRTFEKSMSNVAALSGANAEELQLLKDTAKQFGETTQFSASEAADALSYMALAGWDAQTSCSALGGVLDLAAASGMELASASDMVTDYLTAFGMEAEQSTYFADLLAYAQGNANTTAAGLGEAYKNSAASMHAAGQDIETTTSLLAMMANQGLKGSEAGTALAAVLRDMTAKMEDGKIMIGDTAVAVQDASGNFRDLTDIMKDVENATKGMGDAEKSTALMATFTARSIKGVNLILNAGVDEAASFEEELRNCTGTAGDMAEMMNDNLAGDLTKLNSKIEGTKIEVYESLAPALREAVGEISGVIDSIDWDKVGKKMGNITKKAIEFAKKVIENGEGIIDVIKAIGTVLVATFVVNKVTTFAQAIVGLYETYKKLKTATEAATASQKLLNLAQAATPIGLIVAAVAGLAAGLLYLAGKNKDAAESTEVLTEAELENIEAVNKTRDAYNELKEARNESVAAVQAEFGHYSELADELETLVDANGAVKEGYEDRVNFILTTLNDALGTEMQLVDGVIENYREEKAALDNLIETKKAQAILSANEEAYTDAIKNQKTALNEYVSIQNDLNERIGKMNEATAERQRLQSLGASGYAKEQGLLDNMGYSYQAYQDALNSAIKAENEQKEAVGRLRLAYGEAEENYVNYQATIQNYEGLSSAIISGDADKISTALNNQLNDFITAETGTRRTLEMQVQGMRDNYNELRQAVEEGSTTVTQEMVDNAQAMVVAAVNELAKFEGQATTDAEKGTKAYVAGLESNTTAALEATKGIRKAAEDGLVTGDIPTAEGENFGEGYTNAIMSYYNQAYTAANGMGATSVDGLNSGIDAHSPSRKTTTSGEYFGQGFINGMNNKSSAIYQKAYSLARQAISALKAGQQEGSPSKLTYQSGIYFVQGYINGIASEEKNLQRTVKGMVSTVIKELSKMSNYNFSTVAENASTKFVDAITSKSNYTLNKIKFENEKKLAEFDDEIKKIQEKKAAESEKIQAQSNKKLEALQDRYDNESDKDAKKAIKKQIDAEKENAKKLIKNSDAVYDKLIETQNQYKSAYKTASSEMLNELTSALNDYQTKAKALIDDTINGITERYNQRYDDLIGKQDNLIDKLKSAGDLFEISGAGVMTVNDLKEQTRQITDYTQKLAKIKERVSTELFDQISEYDMKEGSAFIDRLLEMSTSDLDAYNKAYTEKLKAAEKAGDTIYKKDFEKLSKDYKAEINSAFNGIDKELENLGNQALRGFVNGFTSNTDYMSDEVKIFVKSMVDVFKKELQIKSPSRVMMSIGDYAGEGLVNGLKNTIGSIKKTASQMASAVATPLEDVKTSITGARSAVGVNRASGGSQTTSVINNYNLTQNNTSPKSLSALETYQARRQQIALVKAFT